MRSTPVEQGTTRLPVEGPSNHLECASLGASHRSALAGPAGTVRALADGVRSFPSLATRRPVRSNPRTTPDSARCRREDRLGPLVRGWLVDPGQSSSRRGREKRGEQEPEDHALGRSRGGFGSKLHLVTDGRGLPLAVEVTAGQRHESTQFEALMNAVRIGRRSRPRRVAGDKGYSYSRIRRWLRRHGIQAVIPQRSDQKAQHRGRPLELDKDAYRRRSVIECCIGWLKECRRIGTRFEKLALNFLAMIKLAIIPRYLRVLDTPDKA